ncbi:hypothetical protein FGG08_004414 [Glutinoglossum americanum]|uniref:Fungal N-terminal domain-containing protein n=1 Tax=Glutinoglossum americanum TaxID=1670608 RepID=A0A9P8IBG3_9PEZI|nr:hypothetical protein FGG08_004414 [Glutinoglossum americanum]
MADPLSVAASVVGLLAATAKVSNSLGGFISNSINAPSLAIAVRTEINDINTVVSELQPFIDRTERPEASRESMIEVDRFLATLTAVVYTVSELEKVVDSLKKNGEMSILDRMKWAWKKPAIAQLIQRLQAHNKSSAEARSGVSKLCNLVEGSPDTASWLKKIRPGSITQKEGLERDGTDPATTLLGPQGIRDVGWLHRAFEEILLDTRVYRRASSSPSAISLGSSEAPKAGWSMLSMLSLAEVSNISVLTLPLSLSDLYNPQWYDGSSSGADFPSNSQLPTNLGPQGSDPSSHRFPHRDIVGPQSDSRRERPTSTFRGEWSPSPRRKRPSSRIGLLSGGRPPSPRRPPSSRRERTSSSQTRPSTRDRPSTSRRQGQREHSELAPILEYRSVECIDDKDIIDLVSRLGTFIDLHAEHFYLRDGTSSAQSATPGLDDPRTRHTAIRQYIARAIIDGIVLG